RGKRTVTMLCANCHFDNETGALTGHALSDAPGKFGFIYSQNITQDREYGIGDWTDGELAYLLRTGVARDGRYTPPWMIKLPLVSDEDLKDVIAFLRSSDPMVRPVHKPDRPAVPSFFTKLLTRVAFKPLPYPDRPIVAPHPSDRVAYGRYLMVARLDCYSCHSRDFSRQDPLVPEKSLGFMGGGIRMTDRDHRPVYTANLTPDATGLGSWTEERFRRVLKMGLRPDGRPVRSPMTPRPELTDDEIGAMWAYLRTVPPIAATWPTPVPDALDHADTGQTVFRKYGCPSCHGEDGAGRYDLRVGVANHVTDESLIAYIKHPERTKPGVAMPTWDGTIEEREYPPLARFLRALAVPRTARVDVDAGSEAN
ncbi:MAG TPA: c-type cytochrome, partial [Vicinamibacteria bacterium]|nr:c-type cytochrome [Vicinamibacteria bacterium]